MIGIIEDENVRKIDIRDTHLSLRATNGLMRHFGRSNVTIGDVADMTESELDGIKYVGKISKKDILNMLDGFGVVRTIITNRDKIIEYLTKEASERSEERLRDMFWDYSKCGECPFRKQCAKIDDNECYKFIEKLKLEEEYEEG